MLNAVWGPFLGAGDLRHPMVRNGQNVAYWKGERAGRVLLSKQTCFAGCVEANAGDGGPQAVILVTRCYKTLNVAPIGR